MKESISFDTNTCRFESNISEEKIIQAANEAQKPMSVILQITRRCHFNCVFCSESHGIEDPSLKQLKKMNNNLKGVDRVFLSGGEPLIRKDFNEILSIFSEDKVIGLPTNAVAPSGLISDIKEKVAFANIGLDGPRSITNKIRGDYDLIMRGIYRFVENDIPISLTAVVLRSTVDSILYTCQIADTLTARKVKFILPIPKGNALKLPKDEYLLHDEVKPLFKEISSNKELYQWSPKLTFTTWTPETEGYSILIYPNGATFAWPVFSQKDKVLKIGNILNQNIEEIWAAYPYKVNHFRKYLGRSIFIC